MATTTFSATRFDGYKLSRTPKKIVKVYTFKVIGKSFANADRIYFW